MRKELTLQEIKDTTIEILDYVSDLCDKNGLSYNLAAGTCIGAVRHHGFIPWDDDVDIYVPRGDYEKLIEIMSKDKGRFQIKHFSTDRNYVYSYAKVVDTTTETEEQELGVPGYGVFIDVFPLGTMPDDEKEREAVLEKLIKLNNMLGYTKLKGFKRNSLQETVKCIVCKAIGYRRILKKIDKIVQSVSVGLDNAEYCGTIFETKKLKKTEWFKKNIKCEFEGKLYNIPEKYDEYLTFQYGDYMKLPPVEQRVSNHSFKAYRVS